MIVYEGVRQTGRFLKKCGIEIFPKGSCHGPGERGLKKPLSFSSPEPIGTAVTLDPPIMEEKNLFKGEVFHATTWRDVSGFCRTFLQPLRPYRGKPG